VRFTIEGDKYSLKIIPEIELIAELWTAMNPSTGKRQIVDPEGEFIPGETIIKLYYWKRIEGYVTVSMFKVAADGYTLEAVG